LGTDALHQDAISLPIGAEVLQKAIRIENRDVVIDPLLQNFDPHPSKPFMVGKVRKGLQYLNSAYSLAVQNLVSKL